MLEGRPASNGRENSPQATCPSLCPSTTSHPVPVAWQYSGNQGGTFLGLTLFPNDLPDAMEETTVFGVGRGLVMDKLHLQGDDVLVLAEVVQMWWPQGLAATSCLVPGTVPRPEPPHAAGSSGRDHRGSLCPGQQCLLQRKTWETAPASSHVGLTLIKWVTRRLLGVGLLPAAEKGPGPPDLTSQRAFQRQIHPYKTVLGKCMQPSGPQK